LCRYSSTRLLDAERNHAPSQRYARISGDDEGLDGSKFCERHMVATVQRQIAVRESYRTGTVAGTPARPTVSEAALLEHGALPSRPGRRRKVFRHAAGRQFGGAPTEGQPEFPAGRAGPAFGRRQRDEFL